MLKLDLSADAALEVQRLENLRSLRGRAPLASADRISATRVHGARARRLGGPCAIFFVRASIADATGRLLERQLVPVRFALRSSTIDTRRLGTVLKATAVSAARAHLAERLEALLPVHLRRLRRAHDREQQIHRLLGSAPVLVQPGLFDRRAIRELDASRHAEAAITAGIDERLAALENAAEHRPLAGAMQVVLLVHALRR